MSSPKSAAYEKCLEYVERALKQNPLEASEAIIRRRNRLLGLEPKAAKPAQAEPTIDPGRQRQELLQRIDVIRATFWKAPLAALKSSLEQLHAQNFPDINAVVGRLSIVASHRDQLPALWETGTLTGPSLASSRKC